MIVENYFDIVYALALLLIKFVVITYKNILYLLLFVEYKDKNYIYMMYSFLKINFIFISMKNNFLVYGLQDPFNQQIRYVGKSSNGLLKGRQQTAKGYVFSSQNQIQHTQVD